MSVTAWAAGTVTKSNCGPSHEVAPYQVRLDEGNHLIWAGALEDNDQIIQGLSFWDSPLGALRRQFELDHAVQWQQGQSRLPVSSAGGAAVPVVPHQLERDIEQFEHLLSRGVLGSEVGEYVADVVLPDYRRALEAAHSPATGGRGDVHALPSQPQFESVVGLHRKLCTCTRGSPCGAARSGRGTSRPTRVPRTRVLTPPRSGWWISLARRLWLRFESFSWTRRSGSTPRTGTLELTRKLASLRLLSLRSTRSLGPASRA
ncbi:unnamed protein product [Prorocentrum cordatum]|uniref:Uncharacterized protein n=1 Tax=Prorocentrum cordatum TaxID=2364126 RepID=A0ABN9RS07_9DINO|nr:unnamed protein product [Polarella glacialis]